MWDKRWHYTRELVLASILKSIIGAYAIPDFVGMCHMGRYHGVAGITSSTDLSVRYPRVDHEDTLYPSIASGCDHNSVIASLRRVAGA
jgi:hypothetical protein